MITIWKCYRCGAEFLYPKLVDRVEIHGEVDTRRDEHWTEELCPECGSDHVLEMEACRGCEEHAPVEGSDFCAECQEVINEILDKTMESLMTKLYCDKDTALQALWEYHDRNY